MFNKVIKMQIQQMKKKPFEQKMFSSPTLDTVMMVEKTIEKFNGQFNKTQIWERLPRKVMWKTYNVILNYLMEINKIGIADKNILVYIWNPGHAQKLLNTEGVNYE